MMIFDAMRPYWLLKQVKSDHFTYIWRRRAGFLRSSRLQYLFLLRFVCCIHPVESLIVDRKCRNQGECSD